LNLEWTSRDDGALLKKERVIYRNTLDGQNADTVLLACSIVNED
jgi:hypothetical protein